MWIDMHASHEIVSSEAAFGTRVSSEEGDVFANSIR